MQLEIQKQWIILWNWRNDYFKIIRLKMDYFKHI
jgi:hypothetical protein